VRGEGSKYEGVDVSIYIYIYQAPEIYQDFATQIHKFGTHSITPLHSFEDELLRRSAALRNLDDNFTPSTMTSSEQMPWGSLPLELYVLSQWTSLSTSDLSARRRQLAQ
jgi:hypothetical protein